MGASHAVAAAFALLRLDLEAPQLPLGGRRKAVGVGGHAHVRRRGIARGEGGVQHGARLLERGAWIAGNRIEIYGDPPSRYDPFTGGSPLGGVVNGRLGVGAQRRRVGPLVETDLGVATEGVVGDSKHVVGFRNGSTRLRRRRGRTFERPVRRGVGRFPPLRDNDDRRPTRVRAAAFAGAVG